MNQLIIGIDRTYKIWSKFYSPNNISILHIYVNSQTWPLVFWLSVVLLDNDLDEVYINIKYFL